MFVLVSAGRFILLEDTQPLRDNCPFLLLALGDCGAFLDHFRAYVKSTGVGVREAPSETVGDLAEIFFFSFFLSICYSCVAET